MKTLKRRATSLFILVYLYALVLMSCPWPSWEPATNRFLGPLSFGFSELGLLHRLRLFCPTPPLKTGDVYFEVDFDSGLTTRWTYPRSVMMPLDPPGSYNRYLFYYIIWGCGDNQRGEISLPYLGRYIAEQFYKQGLHATEVRIIENVADIPPPVLGIGKPAIPLVGEQIVIMRYNVATGKAVFADTCLQW